MDPSIWLLFLVLFVLLGLGIHAGIALGLAGLFGIWYFAGETAALTQIGGIPYGATAVYTLTVIPMFLLMGAIFHRAGTTTAMYQAAYNWLGSIRGGLPIATTVGSAGFGAVTGSSVANAAMFSRVALPEMVNHGVQKKLALGVVAAAGTVASLIPPSLLLVVFAIFTEQSVSALLVAGLLPGILSTVIYVGGIYLRVRLKPELAPVIEEKVAWSTKVRSLGPLWPAALVFLVVMGSIYAGVATATQAAAVGAAAAIVVCVLQRRLSFSNFGKALIETGNTTASILLIMVGGALFARAMSYSGAVREISNLLTSLALPAVAYLLAYVILVLILGMFLEAFSLLALVVPLMYPLLVDQGYHPIWIAIITVKALEIGLVTPPVGLNIYVVKASSPIPVRMSEVIQGVGPFILMDLITLGLLILFPSISLILPQLMAG